MAQVLPHKQQYTRTRFSSIAVALEKDLPNVYNKSNMSERFDKYLEHLKSVGKRDDKGHKRGPDLLTYVEQGDEKTLESSENTRFEDAQNIPEFLNRIHEFPFKFEGSREVWSADQIEQVVRKILHGTGRLPDLTNAQILGLRDVFTKLLNDLNNDPTAFTLIQGLEKWLRTNINRFGNGKLHVNNSWKAVQRVIMGLDLISDIDDIDPIISARLKSFFQERLQIAGL